MQFAGKGDPDHYKYTEVAKSTDRRFINSIIEKYRLKAVNSKEFILVAERKINCLQQLIASQRRRYKKVESTLYEKINDFSILDKLVQINENWDVCNSILKDKIL